MTLYRVEVEEHRTWIIYVDAEDEIDAEAEAEELVHDFEPDDVDLYTYSRPYTPNSDDTDVWVDGAEGEFITYAEYRERSH